MTRAADRGTHPPAVLREATEDAHRSFLDALAEYHAEGRHLDLDPVRLADRDAFSRYVGALRRAALESAPRAPGQVPETTYWWLAGGHYLGRISVRHRLTDALRQLGGHIGFEVRPSARGRGEARRMLAAVLPAARALGIETALLTCDDDNIASRRAIEANGGELLGKDSGILRFALRT